MEQTMNKSVRLNRQNLINKANALSNLFRLAEAIGYPFSGVKLPDIHKVRTEIATVSGFKTYDEILNNLDEHGHDFTKMYGIDQCKPSFFACEFQAQESKSFALQMFEYIYRDNTAIDTILNSIIIKPVDQQVTEALIRYDTINNIDCDLYAHPYFLIEYYKVVLGFQQIDYIDFSSIRLAKNDYLKEEAYENKYRFKHISACFDVDFPHPELRFKGLTSNFSGTSEIIRYEIQPDVMLYIVKYLGRNNIKNMSKYVQRELVDIALVNLKHFKPNQTNHYYRECVKYWNNVNNDDQVITFNHDLFDHYFISYYALEFNRAVQQLHEEAKPEKIKELDLTVNDLTVDMYGRMTMKIGTYEFTKFMFRYLRQQNRFTYEEGMAKIHSKIIANNMTGEHAADFLPTQLVAYIKAIYNDLRVLNSTKDSINSFYRLYF